MKIADFKERLLLLIEQSASQNKIEQTVYDFFVTKPIPVVQVTHPFLARARMNYNGEVFSNVSQLMYNPDVSKINLQRANYARQQVFYGAVPSKTNYADCQSTASVEVCMEHVRDHAVTRAYMTLSKWIIRRPLTVSILPFSTVSCSRNQDFDSANKNYLRIIQESFGKDQIEACNYFIESLGYMSDIFCQITDKEKCYPISSAYYNVLQTFFRNKGINLDGLIYPSANTEASGMNVVLRKEVVDEGSINLDLVIMFTMQRDPGNPRQISFMPASDEQRPDSNGNFYFKYIW